MTRPCSTRGSRRARAPTRGSTRRSLNTSTSASAVPATACTPTTQAPPGDPANQVATPLTRPSATSSARPQSVPRAVTVDRSYGAVDDRIPRRMPAGATPRRHRPGGAHDRARRTRTDARRRVPARCGQRDSHRGRAPPRTDANPPTRLQPPTATERGAATRRRERNPTHARTRIRPAALPRPVRRHHRRGHGPEGTLERVAARPARTRPERAARRSPATGSRASPRCSCAPASSCPASAGARSRRPPRVVLYAGQRRLLAAQASERLAGTARLRAPRARHGA